jgi:hypothetical protein
MVKDNFFDREMTFKKQLCKKKIIGTKNFAQRLETIGFSKKKN